jgi:hypothetical protein
MTHSERHPWMIDRPVAETSVCTTHNTHKRQTFIPPTRFETAIPASERLQTHGLDRADTGIGWDKIQYLSLVKVKVVFVKTWMHMDGLDVKLQALVTYAVGGGEQSPPHICRFRQRERAPGTSLIRSSVGPTAGIHVIRKKENSGLCWGKTQPRLLGNAWHTDVP